MRPEFGVAMDLFPMKVWIQGCLREAFVCSNQRIPVNFSLCHKVLISV